LLYLPVFAFGQDLVISFAFIKEGDFKSGSFNANVFYIGAVKIDCLRLQNIG